MGTVGMDQAKTNGVMGAGKIKIEDDGEEVDIDDI